MKRKIIQIAGSTQLVSLPRKWCKEHNIQKGEEVDVEEDGDAVIISTKSGAPTSHIKLSYKDLGPFHPHYLTAAYHAGYEGIDVEFRNEKRIDDIRERLANCIGYEMINQGEHTCQIRAISKAESTEFDQILRKTFYLTKTMGENVLEVLKSGNNSRLKEVLSLERTCDRLTDFCIRVLSQHEGKFKKKFLLRIVVSDIERIGDEFRKIAQRIINEKRKVSRPTLLIFESVIMEYDKVQKIFYKLEPQTVGDIFLTISNIEDKLLKLFDKSQVIDQKIIHSLLVIIGLIYEFAFNSIESNLERITKTQN
ncbi:phosphate uptake regulator PhoU [Candidatus Woesearchaeota archaeon]|nr:phosphate uptake regulator PhoU [Candidatus Woesearchaeota archaeon]